MVHQPRSAFPGSSYPLWSGIAPCSGNPVCFSHDLVIALPDETYSDDAQPSIYGVVSMGMRSRSRVWATVSRAGTRYSRDYGCVPVECYSQYRHGRTAPGLVPRLKTSTSEFWR